MGDQPPGSRAAGRRDDDEPDAVRSERPHDPSRVLALSDGVFAIVITLLVLDIHVPDLSQGQSLTDALQQIRPSLIAFATSFILAGMYWVGHRDVFGLIRWTDRGLVWLNILYLLPLCLLPFGASLLGRYNREPVALRIYGLVLLAIAIMRVAIWVYATNRPHLLRRRLDDRQRGAGLGLTVAPGLVYLVAIGVAGFSPVLSLAIFAAVPIVYFLGVTVLRLGRIGKREYWDFT
jgi:uncharacterized membrane protein